MDILIIGGGGREHAIAAALKKSRRAGKLYCAPGNAGISELAECVQIGACEIEKITAFVDSHPNIGLTVVAPDDPLAAGLVDALEARGHRAFGPKANAAVIESSKAFSKHLMRKYGIPTADYEVFDDLDGALKYLSEAKYPLVVKADGLALGKGVIICENRPQAETAVRDMMQAKRFGKSGERVVIEEFLTGREVSVLAFTDGKTLVPMLSGQDHKRIFDGDGGPNTGGMGAFVPSPFFTPAMQDYAMQHIYLPTLRAMESEGRPFSGVLYFGLMIGEDGDIKVLEYNARFGDPETQALLPLLKTDLLDIFDACIDGNLHSLNIEWEDASCVCVILSSGGYPGEFERGKPIEIESLPEDIMLFHAGTKLSGGKLLTNGGRVLGVAAKGESIDKAREKVYAAIPKVRFEGMHFRTDIGIKK